MTPYTIELFRINGDSWRRTRTFWSLLGVGVFLIIIPSIVTPTNSRQIARDMAYASTASAYDQPSKYSGIASEVVATRLYWIGFVSWFGVGIIGFLVLSEMHFRSDWRCSQIQTSIASLRKPQPPRIP
jgi:hypothetical protein